MKFLFIKFSLCKLRKYDTDIETNRDATIKHPRHYLHVKVDPETQFIYLFNLHLIEDNSSATTK